MDKKKEIAERLAKEKGYDSVDFIIKWKNFDIFCANCDNSSDENIFIGLPVFILIDKFLNAHIASDDEWSEFAEYLPD